MKKYYSKNKINLFFSEKYCLRHIMLPIHYNIKKVDAIYKMGLCYLKLNNNTEAVKLFQKIIDN